MKKKSEIALFLFVLGAALACPSLGAPKGSMNPLKQLKAEQKIERKQIKAREKMWKKNLRGQQISHFQVLQMKQQFDYRMSELRLHQKEDLDRMKDQISLGKSQRQHLWSGGTMIQ